MRERGSEKVRKKGGNGGKKGQRADIKIPRVV